MDEATVHRWTTAMGMAMAGCLASALMVTAQAIPGSEALEQAVSARLADVDGLCELEVRVDRQTVTLKGTLPSRDDRAEAVRLAHDVDGVRWVIADVVIDPDRADCTDADRTVGSTDGEGTVRLSDVYRQRAARVYDRAKNR